MHFLIAEDDGVWQRLEQSMVSAAGYDQITAASWPKVVSLLKQNNFDRMIVDLSLASSSDSGIEALQFIARLNPPDTLVICTYLSNKLLEDCHSLPFVKHVIPKSRISDHFDEIIEFFNGQINSEKLQSLILDDLGANKIGNPPGAFLGTESKQTVFVVHGRDATARSEMFALLRALGLNPLEWGAAIRMTGKGSPYIGDVLDVAFHRAAAVVVLLTGDDEARLLKKYCTEKEPTYEKVLTPQPRPNVLFEAGLAFGRKPDRTILVQFGEVRPFTDVAGRHVLRFTGSVDDRNELANRLETAGCVVRRDGKDWLTVGSFRSAFDEAKAPPRRRNTRA